MNLVKRGVEHMLQNVKLFLYFISVSDFCEKLNTVTPQTTTFSYENRHQQKIQPNEDTFLSLND